MNPDKLFDYLDGKLDPAERAEVERRLATDPAAQRELAMAREIHQSIRSGGSREVLSSNADLTPQAGRFGRRVAIACAALVLLNVFIGIAFIIGKTPRKKHSAENEHDIRQQLTSSLQKTAETVLPVPHVANEITLTAPAAERDALADKIVAAATSCGGSAAKALPDENALSVIADLPAGGEPAFRRALAALGAAETTQADQPAGSGRTLIEIRIVAPRAP